MTSSFNLAQLQTARRCLEASAQAYQTQTFSSDLAHCLVDEANVTIVAFRGSASLRDWVTDFECAKKGTLIGAGEKVHHGFLDAIISVTDPLLRQWGRPWPDTPMLITGHSLGGALALLAAQVLARAGAPVQGVYTFGGPRVGNAVWAMNYDAQFQTRTFRFVHENDIVPRIPFWHWGYRHVGQELLGDNFGALKANPPLRWKLISDAWGLYWAWRKQGVLGLVKDDVEDHVVSRYVEWFGEMEKATAENTKNA